MRHLLQPQASPQGDLAHEVVEEQSHDEKLFPLLSTRWRYSDEDNKSTIRSHRFFPELKPQCVHSLSENVPIVRFARSRKFPKFDHKILNMENKSDGDITTPQSCKKVPQIRF